MALGINILLSTHPNKMVLTKGKNKTVSELARSLLKAKRMPNIFWAEVVARAIFILNLAPSKSVQKMTPQKLGVGKNQVLDTCELLGPLHIFSCRMKKEENQMINPKSAFLLL